MEKLTEAQKAQLVRHMNAHDDDTYEIHALWASNNFNTHVTAKECYDLFVKSLF